MDYSDQQVIDVVTRKTTRLFNGMRVDEIAPGDVLLPTLLAVSISGDRVLDFGGAAGLHYVCARQAFPDRQFRWAVVERPEMVRAAKKFANERLAFFSALEEAVEWLGPVDLLHSNGTLQYLDNPEDMQMRLLELRPSSVAWIRMALGPKRKIETQTAFLRDHGPGQADTRVEDVSVTYRVTRMEQAGFLSRHGGYHLMWRGADSFLYIRDGDRATF
jgi:putative methyltransferase (TIGR04325 family)